MQFEKIQYSINESQEGLNKLVNNLETLSNIEKASILILEAIKTNSRIFSCGNGGSMCDAMHFAEELSGRFRENRSALSAIAISDPSFITCAANDFGFEFIFSRFLEANSKPGDLLLAISTSGKSKNIIKACEYCKENNLKLIILTGKENSKISKFPDIEICTPNGKYSDRVQELHTVVIHILVELVESYLI